MSVRKTPTKILIVDDHPLVRAGLVLRISSEPDLEVCGQAASEEEGLALVNTSEPELVLIDISLRSGNGIELIKQIKSKHPKVKMLVISGFDESLYAERALRAGASGYLNKQQSDENVMQAIRTVLDGQRYVSPAIANRLIGQALGNSDESQSTVDRLSDRELEIFRLIGQGLTSSSIANRLFLSTHTIDTHRENIKRKLGLANGSELTRAAVQWVLENG